MWTLIDYAKNDYKKYWKNNPVNLCQIKIQESLGLG